MDSLKAEFTLLSAFSTTFGTLLAILIVLIGTKWWGTIYNYLQKRAEFIEFAKTIPTLPTLPLLGNILELWENDKTPIILAKLSQKLKASNYGFWAGPQLKIIITDPRDYEIILSSAKSTTKDAVYQLMSPIVVNGLINSEGAYHKAHRKLILPLLNDNSVFGKHVERVNHHARNLVAGLSTQIDKGQFDCLEHAKKCISTLAIETLVDTGRFDQDKIDTFAALVGAGLPVFYHRITRPWLHPEFLFRLSPTGRKWYKLCDEAINFIDKELKSDTALWDENFGRAMTPISNFMIDNMMRNGGWTLDEIRSELITLYFGLYDTMEGLLLFNIMMLGMHPEVQEKAREEVNRVIQSEEITKDEAAQLEYIEMIVKETMRLFPIGPMLPRMTTEPIKLTTCTVPEGSSLFLLPFATHRDPKYWDKPEEFIPERFSPENSKNRHPYVFLPFSGGFRTCPGSKLGLTAMKILVAHVIRAFRLELDLKIEDIPLYMHISTRSGMGYPISIKRI